MRAVLEHNINWDRVEKRPGGSYRFHIGRAAIEEESHTLKLEVFLNFSIANEDKEKIKSQLLQEFSDVSAIDLEILLLDKLPASARELKPLVQKNPTQEKLEIQILGKAIKDPAVAIADMVASGEPTVIEGIIFRKEARSLKNNKKMVTLLITDLTDSACIKLFTSEAKWEEMEDQLKEGTRIRVKGPADHDTYEMAAVLMAKDIQSIASIGRHDGSAEKRVELHSHTKMSAMDGLNDVNQMLDTVAGWGHKAIAITDHGVVQSFPEAARHVKKKKLDIKVIYGMEGYLTDDKGKKSNHIILLARNRTGLTNLYRLVSLSHLEHFYRKPKIPKQLLSQYREGLLIGSACEAGEVFQGILSGLPEPELTAIADFYDYLEIQPIINNRFLIEAGKAKDDEELREFNRKIVELGSRTGKPVVATCDAHYGSNEESLYRRILMAGQGYKDAENGEGLFLRTTEEMLSEFAYLGEDIARQVVIENTNHIADQIECISPVPEGRFPPKIENADEKLRSRCLENAKALYGEPLPEIVAKRLERELSSIISNGYAVMYVSAELLVERSLKDGYLVGSRGSVGSSLAATMAGITEVNPLPPHYICENLACRHSHFPEDPGVDCGVDLPDYVCPVCGSNCSKEGFHIPFEVFLGFEGDKEPDIDLNFAGEYQLTAHKFLEEIFGRENVFRAGTIGTIAERTAFGFVKKYYEEKGQEVNKWEIERLVNGCTGVRRTTGQHPGGIIIVPRGHEIYEFCPVQHPANAMDTDIITTHFDYHSIDENLLKLDILGHDVPSMIRLLQDMTGVDPLSVPLKDPKVDTIFVGTKGLDIVVEDYPGTHGTYGIPEFGTRFVRQMLDDIRPSRFSDLIRISGFSHGTDVWINNAQGLIRNGTATITEAISTRDDIMNDLIAKGVPSKVAFKVMESVRKGKGVTDEEVKIMSENGVADWYIESCRRIQYMFPKAHAVAYVMMSYRIAYYKVYYPLAFYAAFFSMKIADFNSAVIMEGFHAVNRRISEIEEKGKGTTQKEEDELIVLEVALECYGRGFGFLPYDRHRSDATRFQIEEGQLRPPFMALNGVGENAAKKLSDERCRGEFFSVDDMRCRTKLNKTALETMRQAGMLKDLPETDQLELF